jgi:hypothetical protein
MAFISPAWHVRLSQYYENEANEQKNISDQAMTVAKNECGSGSGSEKENSRVSLIFTVSFKKGAIIESSLYKFSRLT